MIPALKLSYTLNAAEIIIGVLTLLSVSYVFPSYVALAVGITPFNDAEKSRVLSMKAIPAGLKYILSEPSFRATPVCPIPPCLALNVLT